VAVVEVRGRSMAPALRPGDRLLVEAISFRRREPHAGEIVLASDPRYPTRELVKRIGHVDAGSRSVELSGDAREASTDSRAFGPVAVADIRWRVAGRIWPPGRIGPIGR
jgi:nickel-type superoxide dismutase maturation protease